MGKSANTAVAAVVKSLPSDQQAKVLERVKAARERAEERILNKVQKMVDAAQSKSEFEVLVQDKRTRLAEIKKSIVALREEAKDLKGEIKQAREDFRNR